MSREDDVSGSRVAPIAPLHANIAVQIYAAWRDAGSEIEGNASHFREFLRSFPDMFGTTLSIS
jgi:hypothetical protein